LDVVFSRRSVRACTNEPLDKATVRALLDAAVQAPTALHAEPWAFILIQDRNVLKRYSDTTKALWSAELSHERDLHAIEPRDPLLEVVVTGFNNLRMERRGV